MLVELGADVNVQATGGWSPLHLAAANGHVEVVNTLVQHGADVNVQKTDGSSPLHLAAYGQGADGDELNTAEAVATLLQHGADVLAITARGDAPLHLASTAAVVTLPAAVEYDCTPLSSRSSLSASRIRSLLSFSLPKMKFSSAPATRGDLSVSRRRET